MESGPAASAEQCAGEAGSARDAVERTSAAHGANPAHGPAHVLSPLDGLHDAAVRDLAWLLFSAPLLRPQPAAEPATLFDAPSDPAATLDWLRALDRAPEALHDELAQGRITRVGRLAETLIAWYLRTGPGPRLIAANLPLRRAGVTLGECDFLVETRAGRRLHWELAVKCYLHAGKQPARQGRAHCAARLADYVGPNLQDRFDLKLNHLLTHQLPLSGREEFALTGYAGPWTPQMLMRGWLFYGPDSVLREPVPSNEPVDAPEIDPTHGRGWWVTLQDWPPFAAARAERWRVLPRLEWLAPRQDRDATGFAAPDALAAQCRERDQPLMVAGFAADATCGWKETSRGFIVPDDWPPRAKAFADQ